MENARTSGRDGDLALKSGDGGEDGRYLVLAPLIIRYHNTTNALVRSRWLGKPIRGAEGKRDISNFRIQLAALPRALSNFRRNSNFLAGKCPPTVYTSTQQHVAKKKESSGDEICSRKGRLVRRGGASCRPCIHEPPPCPLIRRGGARLRRA